MGSRHRRIGLPGGLARLGAAVGLALAGALIPGAAEAGSPAGFAVSRVSITAGTGPAAPVAVAADPATRTAFVASDQMGGSVSVIDTKTNTVTAVISLGGYFPQNLAVDPQTDTVYVDGYDSTCCTTRSAVLVIDGVTGKISATIAEPSASLPVGVAVDPATDTVYVTNLLSRNIAIIDGATNQVTGTIAMPAGSYASGVADDSATDTAWVIGVTTISGTRSAALWAINGQTQALTAPVDLGDDATTTGYSGVAVDQAAGTVYAAAGQSLQVIDGVTGTVTGTIPVTAQDVGVDPSTGLVYVTTSGATAVVDGTSGAVIGSFPRGGLSVAADPAAGAVYIASGSGTGNVWVVTPSATTVESPVVTGAQQAYFTVGTPGMRTLQASASPAATFTETGTLPAGLSLGSGGVLAGTPAPGSGGSYLIQVTAANGIAPPDTEAFDIWVNQAPVITSAPAATFRTGKFGSCTIQAAGFPPDITFSEAGSLPAGVTLDTAGRLAGTPAASSGGRYKITITASNGLESTQAFTLTVDQPPRFTSPSRATFTAGAVSRFTITTTAFPAARLTETGHLPQGLTFSPRPGGMAVITGRPARSAQGTYIITITARNSAKETARQTLTIRVR